MRLKVPCTCKKCPSRVKRGSISICCFPISSEDDKLSEVAVYKAPTDGIPEWCPILKVNEKLNSAIDDEKTNMETLIKEVFMTCHSDDMILQ